MKRRGSFARALKGAAGFLVLALVSAGCLYTPATSRINTASGGTVLPWYCEGTPAISNAECASRSVNFDFLLFIAHSNRTVGAATAKGATPLASTPPGVGSAYLRASAPTTFDANSPQALLYAGSSPSDRIAGVAHVVTTGPGAGPPAGYPGTQDVWTEIDAGAGTWMLPVWIVRGYLNHPNVFAPTHPCLATGVTLTSTTDACFLASHTLPLQVLVTNDDGIDAPGIDAVVNGLDGVAGLDISVVAPATNQSGTGDTTTPGGATGQPATTASSFPGHSVNGTPGDSVLYALNVLHETPDLVVSGINSGQNMGPVIALSGTVGAARIAARAGVPSVATSQGLVSGIDPDFPAGTTATLAWVELFRLGLAGPPYMEVANINTPTCLPGSSVRGTVYTTVATSLVGRSYTDQDCTSTVTAIADDVAAFNHGFVGIADAKRR